MLPLLLKANNLKESDVNLINMPPTAMVPSLLQGQVDAILGSVDAYQIQAEAQGAQLDNYRFADYGVPTVSTSIFANNAYIKDNPDVVKKFVAASLKGWSFALDNPAKTIKDLKQVFPEVNEKLATAELAAISPWQAPTAHEAAAIAFSDTGFRRRLYSHWAGEASIGLGLTDDWTLFASA